MMKAERYPSRLTCPKRRAADPALSWTVPTNSPRASIPLG